MIKQFVRNGNLAILLGFCGLIYGMLYARAGNYTLSYAEFECTATDLIGKSPNRSEQCITYERKKNEQ